MDSEETVTAVEADETEDLTALALQPLDQELARDLRLVEAFGSPHLRLGEALAKLDRRQDAGGLRRAETRPRHQLVEIQPRDAGQPTGIGEEGVGLGHGAAAAASGSREDRQQLGIG